MDPVTLPTFHIIGRGRISYAPVTPVTRHTGTSELSRDTTYYPYRFVAEPRQGWRFDHWQIDWTEVSLNDDGSINQSIPYSSLGHANPFQLRDDGGFGGEDMLGYSYINFGGSTYLRYLYSQYELTAVFVDTHTHLLINTSNISSPVTLVYDPTTNLLVADF